MDVGRRAVGHGEGGMRDDADPSGEARRAGAVTDVGRVRDERGRERQHLAREREVLRTVLPQRRDPLVEDAVREQPAHDAMLPLHRVEVAVAVATADRHPGDEVVEDEVVQDDEARRTSERVDDPPVCVRVVADVVDAEVDAARRPPAPSLHDDDVAALAERREQQRRVVGDPRAFGRHRAEQRHPHASSLAIARSHVTCSAISFPARP